MISAVQSYRRRLFTAKVKKYLNNSAAERFSFLRESSLSYGTPFHSQIPFGGDVSPSLPDAICFPCARRRNKRATWSCAAVTRPHNKGTGETSEFEHPSVYWFYWYCFFSNPLSRQQLFYSNAVFVGGELWGIKAPANVTVTRITEMNIYRLIWLSSMSVRLYILHVKFASREVKQCGFRFGRFVFVPFRKVNMQILPTQSA